MPEEIDARFAHSLGMAAGVKALELGARAMVVAARRLSSVELSAALQAGLRAAGLHVIDIGMATTPMLYFATRLMDTGAGIAVTGSHNRPTTTASSSCWMALRSTGTASPRCATPCGGR